MFLVRQYIEFWKVVRTCGVKKLNMFLGYWVAMKKEGFAYDNMGEIGSFFKQTNKRNTDKISFDHLFNV